MSKVGKTKKGNGSCGTKSRRQKSNGGGKSRRHRRSKRTRNCKKCKKSRRRCRKCRKSRRSQRGGSSSIAPQSFNNIWNSMTGTLGNAFNVYGGHPQASVPHFAKSIP